MATSTYLTTEELSHRIKYDARTTRERLKDSVLLEGVPFVTNCQDELMGNLNQRQKPNQCFGPVPAPNSHASTSSCRRPKVSPGAKG